MKVLGHIGYALYVAAFGFCVMVLAKQFVPEFAPYIGICAVIAYVATFVLEVHEEHMIRLQTALRHLNRPSEEEY